ncbi:MAG: transposase [Pseudomonadota bacterium]
MHIVQRGNNRCQCFFERSDYLVYLDMLQDAAEDGECKIHAYVLMSNHIHLLVSPATATSSARMMKSIGERYVQYFNRRYARFGTLWQGRYRSCLVQDERYFLVCQRYIELNPVRAAIVRKPEDYEWSSYRKNAHGIASKIVTPYIAYETIAATDDARHESYRALVREAIDAEDLNLIRRSTNQNTVFGNAQFTEVISRLSGHQLFVKTPPRRRT